jgi:hypothetical protein
MKDLDVAITKAHHVSAVVPIGSLLRVEVRVGVKKRLRKLEGALSGGRVCFGHVLQYGVIVFSLWAGLSALGYASLRWQPRRRT